MSATQTSINAYAHIDATERQRVAAFLLQRTIEMRLTTDRQIATALKIPCGQVSPRRQELIKHKYFAYGVWWMPALMPNVYDRETRNTVQSWCLVIYTGEDMPTMKSKTIDFISKLKWQI